MSNQKAFRITLLVILVFSIALPAQEFAGTPGPIALEDGDVFVFLGDSITHQCLYTQYVENFYFTRYPEKRIFFHNAGVNGDIAADALARFQKDVADHKPKYVSILLGMNDARYKKFDEEIFTTYQVDMELLLGQIKSIKARPILMAPTIFDLRQARKGKGWVRDAAKVRYNASLAYYGAWLLQVAGREGFHYVNMYYPLNKLTRKMRGATPGFTMVEDTVHPETAGQLVMAMAMLKDIGESEVVSEIHLYFDGKSLSKVKVTGGKIGGLGKDGLSFRFAARSLPWVVPPEANKGYKMAGAGRALSRETLKITGLKKGKYRLLIDDQEVGKYSHLDFAAGIHLEENERTPQYQQALKIALLNKEKNQRFVHPLRDLWRLMKQVRKYEDNPSDEGKKRLSRFGITDIKKFKADFDKRGIISQEGILKAERNIYRINRPVKQKYTILPVKQK